MKQVARVAVIGAGVMGAEIAQVCAQHGLHTALHDIDKGVLRVASGRIERTLGKLTAKGSITSAAAAEAIQRIETHMDLEDAVSTADIVIEAIPEVVSLKKDLFARLDELTLRTTILASNTSSIRIAEIASGTQRPDRVIGLHFFQPVLLVPAVELIRASRTSQSTIDAAQGFLSLIGKEALLAEDSPGFIVNRLLPLLVNESLNLLQEGVATAADIDRACTLVLKHPIGPLRIADMAGLDTVLLVMEHMHREIGERYRPSKLLEELVRAGNLGRKTGCGIYEYES